MTTACSGKPYSHAHNRLNTFSGVSCNDLGENGDNLLHHAKCNKPYKTVIHMKHNALILCVIRKLQASPQSGNKCNSIVDSMEL